MKPQPAIVLIEGEYLPRDLPNLLIRLGARVRTTWPAELPKVLRQQPVNLVACGDPSDMPELKHAIERQKPGVPLLLVSDWALRRASRTMDSGLVDDIIPVSLPVEDIATRLHTLAGRQARGVPLQSTCPPASVSQAPPQSTPPAVQPPAVQPPAVQPPAIPPPAPSATAGKAPPSASGWPPPSPGMAPSQYPAGRASGSRFPPSRPPSVPPSSGRAPSSPPPRGWSSSPPPSSQLSGVRRSPIPTEPTFPPPSRGHREAEPVPPDLPWGEDKRTASATRKVIRTLSPPPFPAQEMPTSSPPASVSFPPQSRVPQFPPESGHQKLPPESGHQRPDASIFGPPPIRATTQRPETGSSERALPVQKASAPPPPPRRARKDPGTPAATAPPPPRRSERPSLPVHAAPAAFPSGAPQHYSAPPPPSQRPALAARAHSSTTPPPMVMGSAGAATAAQAAPAPLAYGFTPEPASAASQAQSFFPVVRAIPGGRAAVPPTSPGFSRQAVTPATLSGVAERRRRRRTQSSITLAAMALGGGAALSLGFFTARAWEEGHLRAQAATLSKEVKGWVGEETAKRLTAAFGSRAGTGPASSPPTPRAPKQKADQTPKTEKGSPNAPLLLSDLKASEADPYSGLTKSAERALFVMEDSHEPTCESILGSWSPELPLIEEERPDRALRHKGLAQHYLMTGSESGAKEELCKAVQLDPSGPGAEVLAGLYLTQRSLDNAEQVLRRLLQDSPESETATELLGDVLNQQGDIPASRRTWLKLLDLDSGDRGVLREVSRRWVTHAITALKAKDVARAERLLRRALTLDANNASAAYLLAKVLARQGETKLSQAWSERARELD